MARDRRPSIRSTFTPTTVNVGGTTTASATATSGLAVTFSSTTPAVCTVSGSTVTAIAAGTCTVAADQAGDANYNAATRVTRDITIGKAAQTISPITFTPATLNVGGTTTASATATSGLAVTFSSTTPAVCTVSGAIVTAIAAGTCTVAADQAGDTNYNPATRVTQDITTGKGAQTISPITFTPATLNVGGTTTASATATSGLPVVAFSSTTPAVCTVSGSIVTAIATGTCTVAADQAGDANYNAATQVTRDITIGKGSQTINTITITPTTVNVGGTTTASATATSGLAVTFSSTTPAVCTVSGSTVTAIAAGTCTVAADQAGDANYNAATQVTRDITIGKGSQTISPITFTPPTLNVAGTTTASATATSGLPVTFSSLTPAVCTVSGAIVTGITAGTCTVAADQAGNANYNPATRVTSQDITTGKGSQTISPITFTPPTLNVGGTTTASATATSGLPVTFSSLTPAVCTVSGAIVTAITVGTCTVAADQAGNANYNPATRVTSQDITTGKGSQTISPITFTPPTLNVAGTTTASATATSGLPVTFSSLTPAVCTVSGAIVTGITVGTCTIAADQAGDANYNPATRVTSQDITTGKGSQTISPITFTPPTLNVAGTTTASATATSGLPVTFSSLTPAVCTVSGAIVTGITVGTCTIAADQAGNANYNPATRVTSQDITTGKGSQTISPITFTPPTLNVAGTTTASATATSGLPVTFSSLTPAVCTVSGAIVTGITVGTCTIAADQAGNANYNPATRVTSQDITTGKGSQTISPITFTPPTLNVAGTTTASATATSGLPVTFSSLTPAVCTVSGAIVTGITVGTCTIAADQAGNANYNPATRVTSQDITTGKGSQTISPITFTPPTLNVAGTTTASATATSGLPVTFSSLTPAVCTVSGAIVTGITAGTCTIAADQAGNANYNPATRVNAGHYYWQGIAEHQYDHLYTVNA